MSQFFSVPLCLRGENSFSPRLRGKNYFQKQKATFISEMWPFSILIRQRPTLPHSYPCSTIGPARLNFRVRDGNGCDPRGMITGNFLKYSVYRPRFCVKPGTNRNFEVVSINWTAPPKKMRRHEQQNLAGIQVRALFWSESNNTAKKQGVACFNYSLKDGLRKFYD